MATQATIPEPASISSDVEGKLHRAWRKERRFYHIRGLSHTLVWLVALILLDFLVDWLFKAPGWGRVVLLAVNVAAVAYVVRKHWLAHLRPYDAVRVALEVESRRPELKSLLVSYVQIPAQGRGQASPSLVAALRRQALEVTSPMDFREVISYHQLKRIALLSVCVVLFFGGVSINWSHYFKVLLLRMVNPASAQPYPTSTQIVKVSGDINTQQGQNVVVVAQVAGVIPDGGRLFVRSKGGQWERLSLSSEGPDTFRYTFPEVFQSFEYYMELGDAQSARHTVTVIPPPHVVETQITLRYPAYTGLAPREVATLNFEAPEGTEVEFNLRLDRSLSQAQVAVIPPASEAQTQPQPVLANMHLSENGTRVRWTTTAAQSFPYQFTWTDAEHGYRYAEDIRYFAQVIVDQAPEVEIVSPTAEEKATIHKTMKLDFQARDDYGIAKAAFVYSLNGEDDKPRRIDLEIPAGKEFRQSVAWKLREKIPGLKEGDELTYYVEVADNRNGRQGPQVRRVDPPHKMKIVTGPEFLAWVMERAGDVATEIQLLREQEVKASEQVKTLKDQSGK